MTTTRPLDSKPRPMTVGELSRRTGVPIKTLRQYADWGLVYTVGRSATGYRLFDADALWCIGVIGQLRGLGLTVAELRRLTAIYLERNEPLGPHLAERLQDSRNRLNARIHHLQETLRRIDDFESAHRPELAGDGRVCIAAVGSKVTKHAVGDRVGVSCMADSCRTRQRANRFVLFAGDPLSVRLSTSRARKEA